MNLIYYMYHSQNALNAITALACILLCVEFIYIVKVRKPPYPWSSYSVAFLLFAIACDRLLQLTQPHPVSSTWQLWTQYAANTIILIAASAIPLVRKGTYKRPKFEQLQELNQQLRYSQQLLDGYLEEAPVVAYIKDANRRITYVNGGLAKLFGQDPHGAIGKTDLWGDSAANQQRDLQILAGGGQKELTETLELNSGTSTILDIRFPLSGPNHERMLGGLAADITTQVKRKNRIEVFASIVELSPDAIYSYDAAGNVLTWNSAAERMFGYTRDEMIGQSIEKIIPESKRRELHDIINTLREGQHTLKNFETIRVSRDGTTKPVVLAAALVPALEKQAMMIAIVTRDITQKKLVEQQIRALHEELEARVNELSNTNISLQKARDEALEASSLKSAFVANISHELRTPLGGMLGMSELLAERSLDQDTGRMVSMLQESAQGLLHVVNDILDLAKLEAGKATLEREVFPIRTLINDCVKLFLPSAVNKNLVLDTLIDDAVPTRVSTDPAVLRQILLNLLANSVKFTAHGSITLSVSPDDCDDSQLKISLSDTGIGIDEAAKELLLTPFTRVSLSTDGTTGAGLGLAISKRLVELLGGQMGCESEKGKGSTFWFTVPLPAITTAEQPAAPEPEHAISAHVLAKIKVLSVDDSPVLARLTNMQLNIIGVQVETALTAEEAIEKARTEVFDIIFMDIYLPDMTGHEATQKIRQIEQADGTRRAEIIAITGCSTPADREQALAAGMDDFLPKPVKVEQLRNCIIRHILDRTRRDS